MMFVALIILFCVQLVLVILLRWLRTKKIQTQRVAPIERISVIIPFYNEYDRLLPLLRSMNELTTIEDVSFLFINDHSTDDSVELIRQTLKIPYQLIDNESKPGKKYAIREGVNKVADSFIITWDADNVIPPTYFEALHCIPRANMVVLPVEMVGRFMVGHWAAIEFSWLQLLGFGLAGAGYPVLCNGANLGFEKSAFLRADELRKDYAIPSGDDLFLLKAMREINGTVLSFPQVGLKHERLWRVRTVAPNLPGVLIRQRRRWIKKMPDLMDASTVLGGLVLLAVQVGFILALINLPAGPEWLIPLGIKLIAEYGAAFTYIRFSPARFLALVTNQLWYPFYVLLIAFPLKKEARWEKRA